MNHLPLLIGGLGPTELIIVLVILLLLFGGSRLPSLAKGLGESIRSFKSGINEEPEESKDKTKTA
ncbi:MAG: twin-arginine translocase TatA/TatE family subunit [Acidobacteriota bacterium]|nr:MAG: twin-arginine translocase TatA/TatE family subunit [Acidobacteriota bacterium]